jgi:hypothetical protein
MPREHNAMSEAELRDFLSAVEWVALGVLDASGAPVADTAPAMVSGDQLFFAVAPGSSSDAHLVRDPRCCCAADIFSSYREIKGTTVHGRAKRVEPDPSVAAALEARARAHGLAGGNVYAMPLLQDAFGFDFGKLAHASERGADREGS